MALSTCTEVLHKGMVHSIDEGIFLSAVDSTVFLYINSVLQVLAFINISLYSLQLPLTSLSGNSYFNLRTCKHCESSFQMLLGSLKL